ncbi:DUF4249 domain-containing protein [Reichenbachiella agarivorans]|uniref:DUF4249 domain-containing protein n=1 Tax=Reichenbachiella agarivorans TaxID=2979464 RepID=A0ABY6CT44_9BACT|nr:DUF4249 domain-containing protein [Reichenbachiella agarivorans]UXP33514.1 DUF4249 domain-containing protein [Reichenbachiella agarivorans]
MKNNIIYSLLIFSLGLISCDDQIYPTLEDKEPLLVVDAFINNQASEQKIVISQTQPYFDETRIVGVTDATVNVTYGTGNTQVVFTHQGEGVYTTPTGFGTVGDDFTLTVTAYGETFVSYSHMNRVPTVDSVTFRYEEFDAFGQNETLFLGEFWSKDLLGVGDTYWIKAFKNGEYLSKPEQLNIAYDAGFSAGSAIDDLIFIQPIRDAVNPFDNEDDDIQSPYSDGDSLYVEIHSITNETFEYLNLVLSQTNIPGGFGALFAGPLSNVYGNIQPANENSETVVLGFFSVSAVTSNGKVLKEDEVPRDL